MIFHDYVVYVFIRARYKNTKNMSTYMAILEVDETTRFTDLGF